MLCTKIDEVHLNFCNSELLCELDDLKHDYCGPSVELGYSTVEAPL